MKKKLAIVLATTAMMTSFTVGVMSKGLIEKIEAELRGDFTIVIDGKTQTFRDVNGKKVDPILYDGTTYLPVRAIGELMDKTVYWYQDEKKIVLVDDDDDSLVTDADVIINGSDKDNFGGWDSWFDKWTDKRDDKWNDMWNNKVTVEKAKEIALNKVNIKQDKVVFTKAKIGYENQTIVYEIAFETDSMQYEFKIDVKTGNIITWTKESKEDESLITLDKAKQVALDKAGVKEKNVEFTKTKLTTNDGVKVYEIEFESDTYEYEFEINAKTGKIIEWDKTKKENITLAEAKKIALDKAGEKEKNVDFTKAKLTTNDGVKVYEIEFESDTYEYEFEINAKTGKIIEWDKAKKEIITLAEAKKVALKKAGLSSKTVTYTKAKLTKDDGDQIYEIEFTYNGYEYEFEIDAEDGTVIDWDKEKIK